MRAIARRWLALHDEILAHEQELDRLVREKAPDLLKAHGISTITVAELLVLLGDNPERIKSEAALAKLCGVCPIPASSGKTNRMRLNRGGNRQANAAIYRVAIVRMRDDERTKAYADRRISEGKTRREIVRCIKRYIVREIYRALCPLWQGSCHPRRWPRLDSTEANTAVGSFWLNTERPDTGQVGHGAADALPHKAGIGGPMAGRAQNAAQNK